VILSWRTHEAAAHAPDLEHWAERLLVAASLDEVFMAP